MVPFDVSLSLCPFKQCLTKLYSDWDNVLMKSQPPTPIMFDHFESVRSSLNPVRDLLLMLSSLELTSPICHFWQTISR